MFFQKDYYVKYMQVYNELLTYFAIDAYQISQVKTRRVPLSKYFILIYIIQPIDPFGLCPFHSKSLV